MRRLMLCLRWCSCDMLSGGAIILAFLSPVWAAPKVNTLAPAEANLGTPITVSGSELSTVKGAMLCAARDDECQFPIVVASFEPGADTLKFKVPNSTPIGRYTVRLDFPDNSQPKTLYAGTELHVVPAVLEVKSVVPPTPYPEPDGTFILALIGQGFSQGANMRQNMLIFDDKRALVACPTTNSDPDTCTPGLKISVLDGGRQIVFSNIPKDYQGIRRFQLRVGDVQTTEWKPVTFSSVGRSSPLWYAGGTTLALLLVIVGPLCRKKGQTPGAKRLSYLRALLLDEETWTYSLSKLQFYLWTVVAVFSYLYFTVARSLIQSKVAFADIPAGLPSIILASVATSVLATGISSAKGNKGAGEIEPRLTDLITVGGVIAAERVQFLLWTLVGVGVYLVVTIEVEPSQLQELPKVPDGFLQLAGLSAAGYIGGKLARKPGPRISGVAPTYPPAAGDPLTLRIAGAGLSSSATYLLNNQPVVETNVASVTVNQADDDPAFAKIMTIVINNPVVTLPPAPNTAPHTFSIINPDGQKAVANFT